MSGLLKNILRLPVGKGAQCLLRSGQGVTGMRSLWHMSPALTSRPNRSHVCGPLCKCPNSMRLVHTKGSLYQQKSTATESLEQTQGERELAEFLVDEIAAEKKLQKSTKIPQDIDGFQVNIDGSKILMKKAVGNEAIEVSFNINHTVDTDAEPEIDPSMDKPELGEMRSKPNFEVEIKRGNKTLGFTCSMISPGSQQSEETYNDLFAIDEVVLYEGDWKETNYSVAGEVLDGTLYDLMMNLLEDKGISNDFVKKLSDFSTTYEHACYINMLQQMQNFAAGK